DGRVLHGSWPSCSARARAEPAHHWRRLSVIAGAILVFYIGLRIVNPDLSRANPAYAANVILQLFKWDTSILTPQNEFETFWNTAEALMNATIFLVIVATGFSSVVAI